LEHTNRLTGIFLMQHAPSVVVTTPRPYSGVNWAELRNISAPVTILTQWLHTATNCRTSTTSATSSGERIKYKMTAALSTFLYLQYVTKQNAASPNFREVKVGCDIHNFMLVYKNTSFSSIDALGCLESCHCQH